MIVVVCVVSIVVHYRPDPYLYRAQAVCVGVQGHEDGFLHAFQTEEGPVVHAVLPYYLRVRHGVYLGLTREGWEVRPR